MSFLIKDINEDGYLMVAKYENLSMYMKMPQGDIEISSEENDDNNPLSSILREIKGKTFEVEMSKKGEINEVRNFDAIMEPIVKRFNDFPAEQKEQMKEQMMDAYGDKAIKSSLEMITAFYPDKPLKKHDKWTKKTNLESGMSMVVSTDYQVVDLTSNYALIKGNALVKAPDKDANAETNGMPMQFDFAGTTLSEIKVDLKSCWIIAAKNKKRYKVTHS